jgi:hypothetical protein
LDRLVRGRRAAGFILEVQTSFIMVCWSFMIFWKWPALGLTDQPNYKSFFQFAPEIVWGIVFFVYGVVYFVAAWTRNCIRLRRGCALFGMVLFSLITYLFFTTLSFAYLGLVTYMILAGTNALVFFRLRDKIRA